MDDERYDPAADLNYEEVERFLRIAYEPEDWVEFRAIRPDQERGTVSCYVQVGMFLEARPDAITRWMDSHHSDRYLGLYIGANPRSPRASYGPNRASSVGDVSTFRCAFADLDNCNPNDAVSLLRSANLPEPTMIVHSGRATGTHIYWRFNKEMDAETWEGVQRAIKSRLVAGGADSMKDPPRVMRVPGSYNFKRKNNARVLKEGKRYESYLDLRLSTDEMLPPTFAVAEPGTDADERNLNWTSRRYIASEGIPEGGNEEFSGRNVALFAVACDFISNGFSFEATCARLMPLAVSRDGLPEYEAKRTIANAVNRNPSRTLLVNVNGIDETWTRYMERPQFLDRPLPGLDTPVDPIESLGQIARAVRPATEEELTQLAIMRGDVTLPPIGADAPTDRRESTEVAQREELSDHEAERLRYERELEEIEQWELSAPALISNYDIGILEPEPGSRKRPESVKLYRPAEKIIDDIRDNFNGWPKYAPGMGLFGYRPQGDEADEIVHGLPTAPSLFAFFKAVGQVRWTNEPTIFKKQTVVRELRALKEAEAFELLKERCPNRYRGFCQTPHFPAIDGFYYPKYTLPEPSKNYEVLTQFLNALNPETPEDRALLLAAILTPAWGGPPGARPLFVLASEHGQGSGKTETVKAISEIWGGYYQLSMEKTWSDNAKALMSSTDWLTRCCLWDNVKGRFSSGEIEGAVTSSTIQGHRMYVGTVKRYNDVSFFVTFNNPDMSRDLAQRAVVIKLGSPKTGNFIDWWRSFIAENRRQLIADALSMLSRPSADFNFAAYPDRWRAWQTGVLAKIPGADLDRIMRTMVDRREEVDTETDEGEQIIRAIVAVVSELGLDTGASPEVAISQVQIQRAIEGAGLWKVDPKSTDAQNSRRAGNYVRSRTSSFGILSRGVRQYVNVNDRGEVVSARSSAAASRSPKWVIDMAAARARFGDKIGAEVFQSSIAPGDALDSLDDVDDLDIPI
jgi:hypothetical protein